MTKRQRGLCAVGAAAALTLVACTGGGTSSVSTDLGPVPVTPVPISKTTTIAPTADTTTAITQPAPTGWTIDTSTCADPARAEQPIKGTVKIGSVMPLSGGPSAAFRPIMDGFSCTSRWPATRVCCPATTSPPTFVTINTTPQDSRHRRWIDQ